MSALCPQCGQTISDDFGVIVCSHCQAVLFVDLNGNVQLSQDSHSAENILQNTNAVIEQAAEQEEAVFVEEPSLQVPEGLDYQPDPQSAETQFGTLARFQNPPPEDFALIGEEDVITSEEEAWQEPVSPVVEPELNVDEPLEQGSGEFANADLSVGPLSYTLVIEGIDTKNLRLQLQEALDDPKFHWSSSEILRKIRQGKITLKNLSSVKASVLVARLKETPLKLSWTQEVFK